MKNSAREYMDISAFKKSSILMGMSISYKLLKLNFNTTKYYLLVNNGGNCKILKMIINKITLR